MRAALQVVLGVLGTYHVVMGLLALASLPAASRAVRALYGVVVSDDPQLRHVVRMLGLSAMAIGALLIVAAFSPEQNRPTIVVVAALQLARAVVRLAYRRELAAAFQVSARRNGIAVALLLAEAAVLGIAVMT